MFLWCRFTFLDIEKMGLKVRHYNTLKAKTGPRASHIVQEKDQQLRRLVPIM